MGHTAFTIKAFGIYVVVTGLGLLLAPNLMLGMLGVPEAREVWIRVLGSLAIVVGYYYIACAAGNAHAFFRATIPGRIAFFALGVGLVLLAGAPWTLILFGLADLAGAAWTWSALRAEAQGPGTVPAS
ncbi:hypothetical protein FN976_16355 [Caenimonas sedimenti]|uniref:DUF4345 domain-containing protein n=1 Tax=Caenimonas sedimenti TaxID=2596921 RepID=A0A562ZMV5_9BURK|nr:hypothetical protein [Caenimonas sedimenti]TWO69922.1 hypothetical protein FN976_16355 [Caenimonas sedimenti]